MTTTVNATDYTPSTGYRPRGWQLADVAIAVSRDTPATARPAWADAAGRVVVYRSLPGVPGGYTVAVLINGHAMLAASSSRARDVKAAALAVSAVLADVAGSPLDSLERIADALRAAGFNPGR